MKESTFAVPDGELARRIQAVVQYADRFPAGRLRPPVGIMPGTIRSLHELHLLLAPDDRSLPGINLVALPDWIRNTVGDHELADAVHETNRDTPNYVEVCLKTYHLVGSRLDQARTVTGEEMHS